MRRWVVIGGVVVLAVVIAAAVAWGRQAHECTMVGCTNQVVFDLTAVDPAARASGVSVTVCVNEACDTQPLSPGQAMVFARLGDRLVRSGSLRIVDEHGAELVHLALEGEYEGLESQPNGPGCEPTCWHLAVGMVDGVLRAESDEQLRAHSTGTH